jgi:hypothetical protein
VVCRHRGRSAAAVIDFTSADQPEAQGHDLREDERISPARLGAQGLRSISGDNAKCISPSITGNEWMTSAF